MLKEVNVYIAISLNRRTNQTFQNEKELTCAEGAKIGHEATIPWLLFPFKDPEIPRSFFPRSAIYHRSNYPNKPLMNHPSNSIRSTIVSPAQHARLRFPTAAAQLRAQEPTCRKYIYTYLQRIAMIGTVGGAWGSLSYVQVARECA